MVDHGVAAFLALGGVVLCVTGAEALYADRGHFGAGPIRFTWFAIVLPGGDALLPRPGGADPSEHPTRSPTRSTCCVPARDADPDGRSWRRWRRSSPRRPRSPDRSRWPSRRCSWASCRGSRSSTPPTLEGQIYVPLINWLLCVGVAALVLIFQHSAKLTEIYGVAVTGTFILNTVLFVAVARALWQTPRWRLGLLAVAVPDGRGLVLRRQPGQDRPRSMAVRWSSGWRRLADDHLAQGREILSAQPDRGGGIARRSSSTACATPTRRRDRVPGMAIFLNPDKQTTPLALRAEVEHNHVVPRARS